MPPTTCAYLARVSAWQRTTNGYSFPVLWSTDFQTVTLIKPGLVFKPLPLVGPPHVTPGGFEGLPATPPAIRRPVRVLPIARPPVRPIP